MILIIAKVMIIKSMIIKMIMMFTMMITIWLNTECWNYSTYIRGDFLDSCHHFVTFFEIYSWTVQSRRFTMKKKFNSNIETGVFVWVRKIVINTGEWLWHLSEHCLVFELVYNLIFCSLLKILMVNHNGVFFVQNIWLAKGNFLLLYSFSRKLWDLCQAELMLWRFFNPSWLDIGTFWFLITLCSSPRGW